MKFAVLLSFLLLGCASVPKKVYKQISREHLAGYWVEGKQFLKIKCDGEISFKVESDSWMFRSNPHDSNEGKIKEITDKHIRYKSWIGFSSTITYTRPVRDNKGCSTVTFDGQTLKGGGPIDCEKQLARTVIQTVQEAASAKADPCYN